MWSGSHRLPHLTAFDRQPVVFVTAVTEGRRPLLGCADASDVLVRTWRRSADFDGWYVGRYILMPDHVHFFARPGLGAKSLPVWMKTWKSLASRELCARLGVTPPFWQKDYFDRYLRSDENYREKWWYVLLNPVRKGLCREPEDWPWQGELYDLKR